MNKSKYDNIHRYIAKHRNMVGQMDQVSYVTDVQWSWKRVGGILKKQAVCLKNQPIKSDFTLAIDELTDEQIGE